MKTTKRIISFVLCFIMMLGGYTTVYAQVENVGVSDLPIYLVDGLEIQPYSANFPTNVWNLNTKGKYNFPDGQAQVHCIPNYLFTGVSKVDIYM